MMINTPPKKIVVIGCGNVAWHLAAKLSKEKNTELFVYNHQANKELELFKNAFGAAVFPHLKKIVTDADVYFICVTDSAITSVINSLSYLKSTSILLITAGSFDFTNVNSKLKNIAIFYPIQTFSKEDEIKWKDTSLVIDSKTIAAEKKAKAYALLFTKNIIQLNYQQRLKLHLSAVLVNNFTNSLYVEADKLVNSIRKDLDYKILLPLIKQTTKKIKRITPKKAQTGPAKRKNKVVIQNHLSLLKNNSQLKSLYTLFTNLITEQQK